MTLILPDIHLKKQDYMKWSFKKEKENQKPHQSQVLNIANIFNNTNSKYNQTSWNVKKKKLF